MKKLISRCNFLKMGALASAVMMLAACGGGAGGGKDSGANVDVTGTVSFPLAEQVTFTGMTSYPVGSESDPNNRTIFKRLEEATNVHIDWTAIQADQWSDKITLNMSNPSTLTDFVFTADFSDSDLLRYADQGVIAGCAGGTFDNLCAAADIIGDRGIGTGAFAMSAYPASQPVFTALIGNGVITKLLSSGVTVRSAFCGPCFGAGDVPSNGAFSIRHTTRNFPNREGSKPGNGQSAYVALMDARSIAATAANGGKLTSALGAETSEYTYTFDDSAYKNRFYNGFGNPDKNAELVFGPNITDWPAMPKLGKNLLVKLASVIDDPVTTTDELIPSGETSSYRSNPLGLAEFTLSRKDPEYVGRAKTAVSKPVGDTVLSAVRGIDLERTGHDSEPDIQIGSAVYAVKPGDGSAREQAASCQRVLGGLCNIAREYATKRYRSNLINWGMLPLLYDNDSHTIPFTVDDYLYVPEIRSIVENGTASFDGYIIHKDGNSEKIVLGLAPLTDDEKKIILAGCLINFYHDGL